MAPDSDLDAAVEKTLSLMEENSRRDGSFQLLELGGNLTIRKTIACFSAHWGAALEFSLAFQVLDNSRMPDANTSVNAMVAAVAENSDGAHIPVKLNAPGVKRRGETHYVVTTVAGAQRMTLTIEEPTRSAPMTVYIANLTPSHRLSVKAFRFRACTTT